MAHLVIVFCILLIGHQAASKILLNKCCPKNQQFDELFNCVDNFVDNVQTIDKWWWIPSMNESDVADLVHENTVSYGWYMKKKCVGGRGILLQDVEFILNTVKGEIVLNVSSPSAHHNENDIVHHQYPASEFCVDRFPEDRDVLHLAFLCPCVHNKCVRKCCLDYQKYNLTREMNFTMFSPTDCIDTHDNETHLSRWVPQVATNQKPFPYYRFVNQSPSCDRYGHIRVPRSSSESDDGKRLILKDDLSIEYGGNIYKRDRYCGEYTADGDEMLFFCLSEKGDDMMLYGVLFVIGACFLLLTIILTIILPEMRRNLHGKMTLAHNVMLFIGSVLLGVVMLKGTTNTMSTSECRAISFIIQFTVLSAFFWLNVMCIDIAWAFSGLRPIRGSASQRDHKKLIYYSLYAWGITGIIVMATAIVEFSDTDTRFQPHFGVDGGSCFFNGRIAQTLFFYAPMAGLLLANFILFLYTAAKIIAIKRETAILRSDESSSNKKNKQRLILYGKLFCLMGITWIFEIISFLTNSKSTFFVFADCINLLRGVFIFMIFCCKKKVYVQSSNKLRRLVGMEALENVYSTRDTIQNTRTTTASKTPPTVARATFNKESSLLTVELNKAGK